MEYRVHISSANVKCHTFNSPVWLILAANCTVRLLSPEYVVTQKFGCVNARNNHCWFFCQENYQVVCLQLRRPRRHDTKVHWRHESLNRTVDRHPNKSCLRSVSVPQAETDVPVSIWNRRVSVWTPLLAYCSRWPVSSR
jgi:hypothetical protein